MIELILCCGLPSSGKSTWAQKRQKENYIWISSDEIRASYDWQISNHDVFTKMYQMTLAALKEGCNVIYDATNLLMKHRKALIYNIKHSKLSDIVMFSCEIFLQPINELLERNAARIGKARVPDEVIYRMYKQFQFPQYFEGWDQIHINNNSTGEDMKVCGLSDFDQLNPYHTLPLYDHLRIGASYAHKFGFGETVAMAMWYHDIGKIDTQVIIDGIAHYYGHENVSAYKFALFQYQNNLFTVEEFLEIVFLINYHMRPYNWTEASYTKDKHLFGSHYTKQLKLLHKCDLMAH